MTANEYRQAIADLGLSQIKAAKVIGVTDRTSRRWAKSGAPEYAAQRLSEYKAKLAKGK